MVADVSIRGLYAYRVTAEVLKMGQITMGSAVKLMF
jgi:hypothetical protein